MNKKTAILAASFLLLFLTFILFFFLRRENVPVHLSAEPISSNEVLLTWAGGKDVTQYNIYRSEEPNNGYIRVGFTEEEEYVDSGLRAATVYYYKISQVVDFKESSKSVRVSVMTNSGIPAGLRARAVDFQENLGLGVNLVWDYSVGAEEYYIYRTEDEDGLYEKIGSSINENYYDKDVAPGTTYYYVITQVTAGQEGAYSSPAKATTDLSWSCGNRLDYGGRDYATIRIGGQCWIKENLNVSEGETARDCEIVKHCYNNDEGFCEIYGGLYNFYSASCKQEVEGAQGICPVGWRIPTDNDWATLEMELGMPEGEVRNYGFRGTYEGSKLAGRYDLWKDGILRHSDFFAISDFNALPGGYQPGFNIRLFYNINESALFWSSTQINQESECTFWEPAYATREVVFNNTRIKRDCHTRVNTAYVRCVRDY